MNKSLWFLMGNRLKCCPNKNSHLKCFEVTEDHRLSSHQTVAPLRCFWWVPQFPILSTLGAQCLGGTVENTISALIQTSICIVRSTQNAINSYHIPLHETSTMQTAVFAFYFSILSILGFQFPKFIPSLVPHCLWLALCEASVSDFLLQPLTQKLLKPPSGCSAPIITPQIVASALTIAWHTLQPGTYTSSPERVLGFTLPPKPTKKWIKLKK